MGIRNNHEKPPLTESSAIICFLTTPHGDQKLDYVCTAKNRRAIIQSHYPSWGSETWNPARDLATTLMITVKLIPAHYPSWGSETVFVYAFILDRLPLMGIRNGNGPVFRNPLPTCSLPLMGIRNRPVRFGLPSLPLIVETSDQKKPA